jgi:hypothetical protein
MSDRMPVARDQFIRLINQTIRRHNKYRNGMMVEKVPYEVKPEGYSVACKISDVQEVVEEAVEEVHRKYCNSATPAVNAVDFLPPHAEVKSNLCGMCYSE